MNLKMFKKNFNLILFVVCFGNNVSSRCLQNFFDQNVHLTRSPSSLDSQYKRILSLSPNYKDVRRRGYSNSRDSYLFKLSNTTPLPLTPLQLYNQGALSDYYSIPLSQYNPALHEYNIDALNQYNQISAQDYSQEFQDPYNMGLSQTYNSDPYGQYNPLIHPYNPYILPPYNPFLQAYQQSLLAYYNQVPLRYYNQIPHDYNQIQEYVPPYPEQFSPEEKNERLKEITQRLWQPNVPLPHQHCLDQPSLENTTSNRRGSSLDKDFTKVPHVTPRRKNRKPSNQNQFGNSKMVKPLKDNGEDLLNQVLADKALEEKAGRRGSYQSGKYGKHVVPLYQKQAKKYANPFKSTAIVAPGKENENVNPNTNDDIVAIRSQNNHAYQPSTNWNQFYPNIFSWLGRKRRDVPNKEFTHDHDHVTINKNNAGIDLLHLKRQTNYENEKMSITRSALRSLLRL